MKRIYGCREMKPQEMERLSVLLAEYGFRNAAVGKNYIAFYDDVEVRRMIDVVQRNVGSAGQASGAGGKKVCPGKK